ncbi:MAG TPA: SGNH/GDSL hydrolase family protein, partial [Candidatus Binataceae bacterium]|nr:SGNH/GDSL hydrolase family protein [Candidatus Binataceae bacterium]
MLPVIKHGTDFREMTARVLLICLGIVLGCLIAEAGIRLSGIAKPQFYTYSSGRGWKMLPGASGWQTDEGRAWMKVNRWGFRGFDWTLAKPTGTLRIAVLGDSITEAQQVPENQTFCAVTERTLKHDLPLPSASRFHWVRNVEVMNFGVDGYGTAQELLTLERDVWHFSPDIVVLAFFNGNDLRNNSVALEGDKCRPFYVYRHGTLVLGGPFCDSRWFRFGCFARFESRRSQLLNVLGSARSVLRARWRNWRRRGAAAASGATAPARDRMPLHEEGLEDQIYRPPQGRAWLDAWSVTEAETEMVHQSARQHGAEFLLVTVGAGMQVFPSEPARQNYLRAVHGTSLFYPDSRLKALGERDGFAVLNLPPPMQAYADAHKVFFHGFPNTAMGSGHLNERGHCFAGKLIAQELRRMLA